MNSYPYTQLMIQLGILLRVSIDFAIDWWLERGVLVDYLVLEGYYPRFLQPRNNCSYGGSDYACSHHERVGCAVVKGLLVIQVKATVVGDS